MNDTTFGQEWIPFDVPQAIFVSEGCVVTVANAVAIIVLLRKSFRTKKSTFFVLSMTVADLQAGISGILNHSDIVILFWLNVTLTASLLSLTGVALERAYAVFLPFKHRVSRTRTYIIWIFLLWTCSLNSLFLRRFEVLFHWYIMLGIIACLAVITICYVSIWIKMRFGKTFDNEQASRKNAKLAKTLSIVTLTTLACYLPYTIYLAIYGMKTSTWATFVALGVFQMLLMSNSFWNVLVYSIRMPEFRKELCNLARQCAIYTSRRLFRAHQYDRSCQKSGERGNMSRDNPAIVLGDMASRDTSAERGNMSRDSPAIVLGDLASRDTYAERGNMSRDNPAIVLGDLASRDTYAERGNMSRDNPAIVLGDLASRDTYAERGKMSRDNPAIVLGDLASRDTYAEKGNMSRDNPAIVLGDLATRDTSPERGNMSSDNCDSICIG
ncbi:predicted protein [Nematostella vectensis]|uniref:G-protein coupled receptors family 1 profile domain-containing protein n=1 Tax=Nematostella vectensis TaxID=45351 RepID=A7SNZ2_NEMVE|nr:predicted protein [Nematostella vectensis]|eukprot:XP_001626684.1 predicted protein [Nematostella vectensis]